MDSKKETPLFDNTLVEVGLGPWTVLMFAPYVIWCIILPFFAMAGAFHNPYINHWCYIPELKNTSWSQEEMWNFSIPCLAPFFVVILAFLQREIYGGTRRRSQCTMYNKNYSAATLFTEGEKDVAMQEDNSLVEILPCEEWHYDRTLFSSTVAMEWNLVCNKSTWSALYQTFYFLGTAIGDAFMGYFSDKFGRRLVLRICGLVFLIASFSGGLVKSYSIVLLTRIVLGIIHAAGNVVAYILGMECCPPRYRTVAGLALTTPFSIAAMLFGGLAYLIRDWRVLQLVSSSSIFLFLAISPFMDESPRWLLQKGKLDEAKEVLKRACRWHRVKSPESLLIFLSGVQNPIQTENKKMKKLEEKERKTDCKCSCIEDYSMFFKSPLMLKITVGMFVCWFSTGFAFWGMNLSGSYFSENPFLYVVLISFVEMPGYCAVVPFVARFGRKKVLASSFGACTVAILSVLGVPKDLQWLTFVLTILGKMFITATYAVLYLYASELFPTCIRSKGLNLSSMMARLGAVTVPFITEVSANTYWWAPSAVFGFCSSIGACMALLLPETSNVPLPETVDDLEKIFGTKKKYKVKSKATTQSCCQEEINMDNVESHI